MTRNTNNVALVETPSITLKSIHRDIMNDNANATITTKKMRAQLRVAMNDVHVHNASWIFTQSQYDTVRCMFDDAYRAKIERANARNAKRNTKSNDAPRTPRKPRAKSNVETSNDATTNDTPAVE